MFVRTFIVLATLLAAPAALAKADLKTTVTQSPGVSPVYGATTVTVTVRNIGNKKASGCAVSVALPATHTSPQVYVMGNVLGVGNGCTLSGTTVTCGLGNINAGVTKTVSVDIELPESAAPLVFTASATTSSSETTLSNNAASLTASLSYVPVSLVGDVPVTNNHCTGTGLTAWFECTLFPSSVTWHDAILWGNGTITFPGAPGYGGTWSQPTPDALVFSYTDPGNNVFATFSGHGVDADCFEGLTTFIPGPYVSPYEVCK
ncbi:MAG: hypothetical protein KC635_16740 [Myxococcales bacterium]|nr:hypothetical protein [Myxococcales bacterium]MCB9737109.1 hypothetical protein [Deltaproteobacteria bacterium]